jgi:putative sterol carrier protein
MTEDPRQMLSDAVKDQPDEAIMEFVHNLGGTEQFLDMTFEGMEQALNQEAAQDCVISYELTEGSDTYGYTVTVKDKTAAVAKGAAPDARVTLGLAVPDYLRLISGHLDGMQAFMQGKLKLKGDMMFAAQIQRMFQT